MISFEHVFAKTLQPQDRARVPELHARLAEDLAGCRCLQQPQNVLKWTGLFGGPSYGYDATRGANRLLANGGNWNSVKRPKLVAAHYRGFGVPRGVQRHVGNTGYEYP